MKNMDAKDIVLSISLALLVLSACCLGGEKKGGEALLVAVSIPPQAEMVEKIGKERVSVTVMVPEGADPHTYEPKPSQLVSFSNADLFVYVGSGIDFELAWTDRLMEMNKGIHEVNSSKGIDLITSQDPDEPGLDPHVWTSVRNAKIMAINTYQGLSIVDPEGRAYYQRNLDAYLEELESLDRNITKSVQKKTKKKFIVYHPAWEYFAKDYGLEQIAVEQEGKEPSPKWMVEIVDLAREENISIVFASPAFSTASAETLANEIGGRVVLIDPLSKEYLENMRDVAVAFTET